MLVGLIIDCGVQNADCRLDVDGGDSIVVGVGVCAGFDTGSAINVHGLRIASSQG